MFFNEQILRKKEQPLPLIIGRLQDLDLTINNRWNLHAICFSIVLSIEAFLCGFDLFT